MTFTLGKLARATGYPMTSATPKPDEIARARAAIDVASHKLASELAIPLGELLGATRGSPHVAFVRQMMIYLVNTAFDLSEEAIAAAIGRDPTTIKHAIALIEEIRDNPEDDDMLEKLTGELQTSGARRSAALREPALQSPRARGRAKTVKPGA